MSDVMRLLRRRRFEGGKVVGLEEDREASSVASGALCAALMGTERECLVGRKT